MERSKGAFSSLRESLEGYLGQPGALDNNVLILSVIVGGLAILWLTARAGGGNIKLADALELQQQEMELCGVPVFNRPRRLISEHKHWESMPEPFLIELATRLGDSQTVIDFMIFAESRRLHRKRLPRIAAQDQPQDAVNAVSALLFQFGRKRRRDSAAALTLAMRLDPENPEIVLALAANHFAAKRYDEAMAPLESAMMQCQGVLDMVQGQPTPHRKAKRRIKALESRLRKATQMYEVCLRQ